MGRAIVREPQVFLMDEPLSNLDAKLRVQMRAEITRLQEQLGVTTIFVTHDQVEAMTMGDRIVVMRKGAPAAGPPELLYDEPANLFVAEFIGSPAMNVVRGRLDDGALVVGDQRLELPQGLVDGAPEPRRTADATSPSASGQSICSTRRRLSIRDSAARSSSARPCPPSAWSTRPSPRSRC